MTGIKPKTIPDKSGSTIFKKVLKTRNLKTAFLKASKVRQKKKTRTLKNVCDYCDFRR